MAAATVTIGPYTVGEKPPPLVYTFLDSAGVAVNLTGYTAVFNHRPVDGESAAGLASVTTPLAGQVTHTWTGAELTTPGDHWAEFWVGNTVNRLCSLRILYSVRAAVGPVPSI